MSRGQETTHLWLHIVKAKIPLQGDIQMWEWQKGFSLQNQSSGKVFLKDQHI